MPFQVETSRHLILDDLEDNLQWIARGDPLSAHPHYKNPRPKPKPLAYYQAAPNGLHELFADCSESLSDRTALIANRNADILVRAALACLRAEADGHKLASLQSLVPNYLPAIPRDPADGMPVRFLPEKRVLYLVGVDLKDDQGRSGFDPDLEEDTTFDLTFQLPDVVRR